MNKAIVIFLLICALLNSFSCSNFFCKNDAGITVSELLKIYASDHDIPYCNLLKNAADKDSLALVSLLKLEIMDGASYDHADVILALFLYLGEDFIINATHDLSQKEIVRVKSDIRVGIEYAELGPKTNFDNLFPKLSQEWNEK